MTRANTTPAAGGPMTADRLARILTSRGNASHDTVDQMIRGEKFDPTFHATLAASNAQFATVLLLRDLATISTERADEMARTIWEAWQSGEVGEWLADWAEEYGQTPAAVNSGTVR